MTRTQQVSRKDVSDEVLPIYERMFGDRDPVVEPGTSTGTPGNWWTVFAQAPDLLAHMQAGFNLFSSEDRELPSSLRELALTRAGFLVGSQFVFSQHCKAARHAGLNDNQITAIPAWGLSDIWTPLERAVLTYTDSIVLQQGRVQDETFAALTAELSEVAVIELTYAAASYQLHGAMCRALRLEYDDVAERVVEIAAPGAGDQDVMGAISGR